MFILGLLSFNIFLGDLFLIVKGFKIASDYNTVYNSVDTVEDAIP